MIGNIGVIVGVVLLIVLALRGVSVIVASLLCAVVVAVTNGQSVVTALMTDYTQSMFGFARMFFMLFISGVVFGRLMTQSNAAASVAYALSSRLGPDRTLIIGTLVCALLTYGGINVFIVIFTVYPLGLGLMQRSNVPKRLFMAAVSLGAGTFTMTAMPGSPSIHNVIMAKSLATPLTAAAGIGLVASAVMLTLGMVYLEWERKKAKARGEGFEPAPTDVIPDEPDPSTMPHWLVASVPMVVVLAIILVPQWINSLFSLAEGAQGTYAPLMVMATTQPLVWTCVALVVGTLVGFVLFCRYVKHPLAIVGRGAESAILPLINTAVVIGFGGVVKATPVFENFAHLMLHSGINPIISAVVSINIMSGIVGSASGGLGIFSAFLAEHYINAGVPPQLLHRLVAIGAGGLDSLPHCGVIITTLTIMGLSHKQAYKDTAVVTVLVPLIALLVVLAGVLLFG